MTVIQLIRELSNMPSDFKVLIPSGHDTATGESDTEIKFVTWDVNKGVILLEGK